jgi:hypothetical protein
MLRTAGDHGSRITLDGMGPRRTAVGIASVAVTGVLLAVASATGQPAKLPPPSVGRSIDIGLVSGTVTVTPPGRRLFTLGVQDRNIPVGSLIDTTRGRVDLRSASPPGSAAARAGKVQDANFFDGAFTVRQSHATPVAQIKLAGGQIGKCTATTAGVPHRTPPHDVLRLLRASGPGKFSTEGRYAAATVRGTVWLTEDFCDGTLVQVTRGVVTVRNLVTHATVTVTGGHSYFAAAPG